METVIDKIRRARIASSHLKMLDTNKKNEYLEHIKKSILDNSDVIINANRMDLKNAEMTSLSSPLLKRLLCDEKKISEIIAMITAVIEQKDCVYQEIMRRALSENLILSKRYVPLGLIGMIFESRPDALVQMAILCLKTNNCVILKGGSEARETNKALYAIIANATGGINANANANANGSAIDGWIQLMEERTEVDEMIRLKNNESVDLIIPRGSESFVQYIMQYARVPVLGHSDGVCHIYVEEHADMAMTADIIKDAKLQYPATCNAIECLLIDRAIISMIPRILAPSLEKGLILEVDEEISSVLTEHNIPHTIIESDAWGKEYTDVILAVKVVDNIAEAVNHINTYGSKHTDVIMTQDEPTARVFQNMVDSASVLWNCSTRFADGYRYGLGAEVGTSTSKIHARGPVGMEGLLSTQWVLDGKGHIVTPFCDGSEVFTHKDI